MPSSLPTVVALCGGACLGALLRWKLGHWFSTPPGLPWGTWVANALGGLLIGCIVGTLQAHPGVDPVWRALLVTGFLGALTTFSTFSLEVVELLMVHRWATALGWCILHVMTSLSLTALGLWSAQLLWGGRPA